VQQIAVEQQESGDSLLSAEEADMGVELGCAEVLKQLCQAMMQIKQLSVNIIVDETETMKVNEQRQIKVMASVEDGYPVNIPVKCQLKAVRTNMAVDALIKRETHGEFIITLTTCVCGRHQVFINANGQPVLGSPFPVFVTISPTELVMEEAVSIGEDQFLNLVAIAVNSLGKIIIGKEGGDVLVLSNEGKTLRTASQSQTRICSLTGVAVDGADNVYFVDGENSVIGKMNKKCNILKFHSREQAGFEDITVAGNEVMVLKSDSITVFNNNLYLLKCIKVKGNIELLHLTSDAEGTVFITRSDYTIQVKAKNSDKIVSLDCENNSELVGFEPGQIQVSGQYLYVEDPNYASIIVFSTDGDYVATLCDVWGPMCTDQDGFLYCDVSNTSALSCV